jgi:hypothetical protein
VDEARLVERLTSIDEDLKTCWLAAVTLRSDRQAWHRLRPALEGYRHGPALLWRWYRDSILAGCRRLIEDTSKRDRISVVRSLRELHRVAPEVTVEALAALRRERRPDRPGDALGDARQALSLALTGTPDNDVTVITRAAVAEDQARLKSLHKDVVDHANRLVAHHGTEDPPTIDETHLSALLDDVVDVVARWVRVVDGVELVSDPLDYPGVEAIARACELFNWTDYRMAVHEAQTRALGYAAPAEAYRDLEATARVQYVFDDISRDA